MKRACVYVRPDGVYVHALSITIAGYGVADKPYLKASSVPSINEAVSAIMSALDATRCDIPEPESPAELEEAFAQSVGFKNWRLFRKGAKLILVEAEQEHVTVTPSVAIRGGYSYLDGISCVNTKEELASAIVKALELCR